MKVAVDVGAICSKKYFGTYTFTENFVQALQKYDRVNKYLYYSFCFSNQISSVIKLPSNLFSFWGMFDDVVLVLNQQPPRLTRGKIISFSHGLSYRYFPELYSKNDVARLEKQLSEMIKRADIIVVSSQKVKDELSTMYQYIEKRVMVLPFGIPFDMENKVRVVKSVKLKDKQKYFLYVGMDHVIKNVEFIKKVFNEFIQDENYKNYELKIISDNISRVELKKLYQNATALLTASHYESFNFPVLEALVNDCPVIGLKSAIIPEMKEFVNICDNNIDNFVSKMKIVCYKKQVINHKKLINIFSWKKYIEELVKFF